MRQFLPHAALAAFILTVTAAGATATLANDISFRFPETCGHACRAQALVSVVAPAPRHAHAAQKPSDHRPHAVTGRLRDDEMAGLALVA